MGIRAGMDDTLKRCIVCVVKYQRYFSDVSSAPLTEILLQGVDEFRRRESSAPAVNRTQSFSTWSSYYIGSGSLFFFYCDKCCVT
jgi:hypothetical protein